MGNQFQKCMQLATKIDSNSVRAKIEFIKNKKIEKEIIRVMNMMPKWKFSGNSNYKRQIFIIIPIQIPFYKVGIEK